MLYKVLIKLIKLLCYRPVNFAWALHPWDTLTETDLDRCDFLSVT